MGYIQGCLLGNRSLEVADQSVPIRDRLASHFRTWSGQFERCIADAQNTGATTNPQHASILASFLLNGWEGLVLRMRVEKSDAPLKEFVVVVFGSLLV